MSQYHAIPLADKGFIPVSERNPVRWYVVRDGQEWPAIAGPFATMADADKHAAALNNVGEV